MNYNQNSDRIFGRLANRRFRRTLIGLVIIGITVRLALMIMTPLYPSEKMLPGYNDEPLHLHYVEYVADGGGWAVYNPASSESDSLTAEFMQSPLYYFLSAPVFKVADAAHRGWGLYGARLVSLLCGLIAALFTFRTALIWSGNRKIAAGTLAAMLFAPNTVLFTSLVTNDALLICTAALAIHSLVLCRIEKGSLVRQMLTGVFLATTVWAKLSGLTLLPLALLAGSPTDPPRLRWAARIRVLLVALALASPLYVWNYKHYGQKIPGGSSPLVERYSPEQTTGTKGGALYHPLKAVKIWLRTAAQPFGDSRWGSITEKITSLFWILVWGGCFLTGIWKSIYDHPSGMMFILAVILVGVGFLWRSVFMFQVEFRLFAPAFPALAILTSRATVMLPFPPATQGLIWFLPMLILAFY